MFVHSPLATTEEKPLLRISAADMKSCFVSWIPNFWTLGFELLVWADATAKMQIVLNNITKRFISRSFLFWLTNLAGVGLILKYLFVRYG
jgi:hypothetical protein